MLFIKKLKPISRAAENEAVNRGKISGIHFVVTPYNGGSREQQETRTKPVK